MVIIKRNTISGYMVRTLKKLRAQADRPEFKFEPLDSSAGEFGAGCHTSLSFGFLIELMWG